MLIRDCSAGRFLAGSAPQKRHCLPWGAHVVGFVQLLLRFHSPSAHNPVPGGRGGHRSQCCAAACSSAKTRGLGRGGGGTEEPPPGECAAKTEGAASVCQGAGGWAAHFQRLLAEPLKCPSSHEAASLILAGWDSRSPDSAAHLALPKHSHCQASWVGDAGLAWAQAGLARPEPHTHQGPPGRQAPPWPTYLRCIHRCRCWGRPHTWPRSCTACLHTRQCRSGTGGR